MTPPNGQSKIKTANIVGVGAFVLGAFMRGFFADEWFGDLLGFTIYAFGFMYWSHTQEAFWPKGGSLEWEKFRRAGFLRYIAPWFFGGLLMGLVMGPAGYLIRLVFDGPSKTPSFFSYTKLVLFLWACIGILMGLWAWFDNQLLYRKARSKPSTGTATEP